MTEDPNDDDFDDGVEMDEVTVIDKINILLTLIENSPSEKYKALALVLQEARFQLLHAWNEVQYYMELCESYEKSIKELGDKLK
jgi:hypothetical protein